MDDPRRSEKSSSADLPRDQDSEEAKEALQTTHSTDTGSTHSHEDVEHIGQEPQLSRTNTRRTARSLRLSLKSTVPAVDSVNDVSSIPDGGTVAWLQVLGAFFLLFNAWGIINSFGSYQTYYMADLLRHQTPAAIAWIGSVQSFLLDFIGPLSGPIYDAGYVRPLMLTGTFLVVFGHMMLSLCTSYWQVFLSQAVCVGVGAGCLYVPGIAVLSTYFHRHLAAAMGLAAVGSSLGGVIYPIVLYNLIPRIGFGWATRVVAFIALATLLVSNTVLRVRVLPAAKRSLLDLPSFKEPPYVLFVIGGMLAFAGLYPVLVYVESFAQDRRLLSDGLSFYTLAIINSASSLGRILPNLIADRTGPLNVLIPACAASGVIAFTLAAVRSGGGLIAVCVIYGFVTGSLVSLPPTVFVTLSQHKRHIIGARMGMGFLIFGIGLLIGTPASGWILDAAGYNAVWFFSGGLLLAGSAIMFACRTAKVGSFRLFVKA